MNKKIMLCFAAAVVTIAFGVIIIPPIISKYGNKLYKSSLSTEKINFDDLGPEVVKKD